VYFTGQCTWRLLRRVSSQHDSAAPCQQHGSTRRALERHGAPSARALFFCSSVSSDALDFLARSSSPLLFSSSTPVPSMCFFALSSSFLPMAHGPRGNAVRGISFGCRLGVAGLAILRPAGAGQPGQAAGVARHVPLARGTLARCLWREGAPRQELTGQPEPRASWEKH